MSNTDNKNLDKSNPTQPPKSNNNDTQVWTAKALKPLTRKQAAFVKHLVDNPKDSATDAVKATYGKADRPVTELSARNIASENLTKPNILLELSKHSETAEYTLIDVMEKSRQYASLGGKEGASYAGVAVSAANSILDRLHGKATQRTEVKTEAVIINVDLSANA